MDSSSSNRSFDHPNVERLRKHKFIKRLREKAKLRRLNVELQARVKRNVETKQLQIPHSNVNECERIIDTYSSDSKDVSCVSNESVLNSDISMDNSSMQSELMDDFESRIEHQDIESSHLLRFMVISTILK